MAVLSILWRSIGTLRLHISMPGSLNLAVSDKRREMGAAPSSGEPVRAENRPDFRKAIRALNNAREKSPDNLEYRRVLAEALTESGRQRDLQSALEQYDAIIKSYRKSIRLGRPVTESAQVYFNRGLLASKLSALEARWLTTSRALSCSIVDGLTSSHGMAKSCIGINKKEGGEGYVRKKSYFQLVMEQYDKNHVRSNYYMGKITLREWDKQANRRPYDKLHKLATEYQNVVVTMERLNSQRRISTSGTSCVLPINGLTTRCIRNILRRISGRQGSKARSFGTFAT